LRVTVSLFTILKKYGQDVLGDDGSLDVPEDCTLTGLAGLIGIPESIPKVYLVSGLPKDGAGTLREHDDVKIFSFIGGG